MTISILLADDHKIFREGLKALLEQEKDLSIIADTDDGAVAVELSLSLLPDVAILDICMPNFNGIEVSRRIAASEQPTRVIILSMHMDKEYVSEAMRAGAMGFLAKSCTSSELVNAIHDVVAGKPYLSSTISSALVGLITPPQPDLPGSTLRRADYPLSRREHEVLRLLAEGNCTKEVAALLSLSSKTVETYRLNLMKKLGITNMANLVRYAIREGIIEVA
jgi:DNA-binding NarL/FixJ family response regulator